MNKNIEILVGIPCSGKSTYTSKKTEYDFVESVVCISRDEIRERIGGKNYIHTSTSELEVTKMFNFEFEYYLSSRLTHTIILDNTHCKEGYIDEIIKKYGSQNNIEIKFFDIPLWKAHIRNILRYFKNRKWIPFKVMNQMYKNYNKINRKKYTKYLPIQEYL